MQSIYQPLSSLFKRIQGNANNNISNSKSKHKQQYKQQYHQQQQQSKARMSNRKVASSAAGAKDHHSNRQKKSGMSVTETEEMGGIIMMGHYEDAQLNPSNCGKSRNNSTPSVQQVNPAPVAARNTNPDATAPRVQVPVRHSCSNCSTIGHRQPQCPHLPCKHCGMMGHKSSYCLSTEAEKDEKYEASLAKRREKDRLNRK